jgi:hypothetical protein
MLFDLRGRGRRRVVQVIYLALAVLMGGGLVLFGIGGNTNGGLFDAFSSGNGGSTTSSYTKQIESTQKQIDTNPKNAAAWAKLASLRLAEGGANGGFDQNPDGLKGFRQASTAWGRYLALKPAKVDQSVGRQMINVYGTSGLNLPDKAVGVMDLIVDQTQPPEAYLYKQYALLAFTAGQTRKGDLAIDKAVALSPPAERKQVRAALESLKAQASQAASGGGSTGTATQTTTGG